MKNNYFIEGLQGAGKTTLVRNISSMLPDCKVFHEGDYSPVELAWCAYVTKEQYEIKLAYLIQRIGTEYLKNRRNKGFRHIWRDRKPFSFYDSSYSDMKQK